MADDQQQQQQQNNDQQQQQQQNNNQQQQQQQQQPNQVDWAAWSKAAPTDDSSFFIHKKGFKDVNGFVSSYAELEGKINAKGVIVPGANAKAEEITAFHRALGVPAKVEEYDLGGWKPPAIEGMPWDSGAQTKILTRLHAKGATPDVVREALSAYGEFVTASHTQMMQTLKESVATSSAALKKDWGAEYDGNMDISNRYAHQIFGDDLVAATELRLADGTFLLDNPIIARALFKGGNGNIEDKDVHGDRSGGGNRGGVLTQAEAEAAKKAIQSDPEKAKAAVDKQHPQHTSVVAELNRYDDIITAAKAKK